MHQTHRRVSVHPPSGPLGMNVELVDPALPFQKGTATETSTGGLQPIELKAAMVDRGVTPPQSVVGSAPRLDFREGDEEGD